jgi:hypothetical protein
MRHKMRDKLAHGCSIPLGKGNKIQLQNQNALRIREKYPRWVKLNKIQRQDENAPRMREKFPRLVKPNLIKLTNRILQKWIVYKCFQIS